MKEPILQLTGLDLVFITISIVSIVVNIIQFILAKKATDNLKTPVSSAATALFNDIRTKANVVYSIQTSSFPDTNALAEVVRKEYWQFVLNTHGYLLGFQEAVVGILVSLDPNDREGKKAFRAAEYGLTDQEKAIRAINFRRYEERQTGGGA